jgi:ATP-dependent DNA helicase RecG
MDAKLSSLLAEIKIPKIGPKTLEALHARSIFTVIDLLLCFPLHYKNKLKLSMIEDLQADQDAYIEGVIVQINKPGKIFKALLQDSDRRRLDLVFFQQNQWIMDKLRVGTRVRVYGKITFNDYGPQMAHPEIEYIGWGQLFLPKFEPVYPTIQGASQRSLSLAVDYLLNAKDRFFGSQYATFYRCLQVLHGWRLTPDELNGYLSLQQKASEELAFIEGLAYFIKLHDKERLMQREAVLLAPGKLTEQLVNALPYQLTAGQADIWKEIQVDFAQGYATHRLVQGDVGSGKTILGFLSLTAAVDAGYQAVMMAPTEILAQQHYESLHTLLGSAVKVGLLTGSLTIAQRRLLLMEVESGAIDILIGTQALFQESVTFKDLVLAVIDEQQRFGVAQRAKLLSKGKQAVHHLTLTATPIPRTLAMAMFGHLSISTLREKPPGRTPIDTYTLSRSKMDIALNSVSNCVKKKMQCYWICPLIEQSEVIEAQAVEQSYQFLKEKLPHIHMEPLHGRMPSLKRTEILNKFYDGSIDMIVSTLVIEVGINNPNATLMVIESPDRLGLAQLHQLRGRVGRGHQKSYCLLIYGDSLTETGIQRLQSLCEYDDGFQLAEIDLELRGPGQLLGAKQSGFTSFKFFDLQKHQYLIEPILKKIPHITSEEMNLIEILFTETNDQIYLEN